MGRLDPLMARRTQLKLLHDRAIGWANLEHKGWSKNSVCSSCGIPAHVRGLQAGSLKCRECYMSGAR